MNLLYFKDFLESNDVLMLNFLQQCHFPRRQLKPMATSLELNHSPRLLQNTLHRHYINVWLYQYNPLFNIAANQFSNYLV